ncbi:MAG: formylglycine-generating enzyme family protein [Phycisphaerales bacterium]
MSTSSANAINLRRHAGRDAVTGHSSTTVGARIGLALAIAVSGMATLGQAAAPSTTADPAAPPAPREEPRTAGTVAVPAGGVRHELGFVLCRIPAGTFTMGSRPGEPGHRDNESPAHAVTISQDFMLSATEVTIGQFQAFVDATGYVTDAERDAAGGFGFDWSTGEIAQVHGLDFRDPGFPDWVPGPDHPAILLTWNDAEAFCRWLSSRDGQTYRLPTEAEWERAARGGTESPWWFGASATGRANVADAALRSAVPAMRETADWHDGHAFLAPVASYPANPYGLHDVHGNVWEWCADVHDDTAYIARETVPDRPTVDPTGPSAGAFRVIRGGGWLNPPAATRAAQRVYFRPTFRYCLLSGFRVAMDVPPVTEARASADEPAGP